VSGGCAVTITLTDDQVGEVLQGSSGVNGVAGLLSEMSELDQLRAVVAPFIGDMAYSTATFRAAFVLAALPRDGSERTITDIAIEVGLSKSVTHRYMVSWMALGMVCKDPGSRRYRRAHTPTRHRNRHRHRHRPGHA
jgi:hypothetical protein